MNNGGDIMSYQTLYRRWRPQVFTDVTGQEHVVRTLQNALEQRRVAHAYLFCGPRGTGKTSVARILAKGVNCLNGPAREPCNNCSFCQEISASRLLDVLELDAASNRGIDEIRELREKVRYAPVEARRKVYIIDEVHMLTTEAANALLKILEEPPAHVLFILATTEPHRLPATVVSRCQRLDFKLISFAGIMERLRAVAGELDRKVSETALQLIAEEAAGGLRDALSLFEQALAYAESEVTENDVLTVLGSVGRDVFYNFTAAILERDLSAALLIVNDVSSAGRDLQHFTQQAIAYYRDLMVVLSCREEAELLGIAPEWADRLAGQGKAMGLALVGRALAVFHDLLTEIRWSTRPRLLLELAVFRLLGVEGEVPPGPEKVTQTGKTKTGMRAEEFAETPDLRQMSRMWQRILEQVKRESIQTHALLLEAELLSCAGQVLEIGFNSDFHREMMEKPEYKQLLGNAVKVVLGYGVSVQCAQLNSRGKDAQGKKMSQEEIVDTAAEIFGGKIIG
jgi:DNA polymerase-3 subunit gamma/tau